MTFKLGLTGSIGMGKSTTARMFADLGCALWDADAAVARLYGPDGAALGPISSLLPDAIVDGTLDRAVLRREIAKDPGLLARIEAIVHPLVRADRERAVQETDADIIVCDIPLLFETGSDREMDAVACVSVDAETQRARVLERGTMSEEDFEMILRRQMPNAEKCDRADFVIPTDTMENARNQVLDIVNRIRGGSDHA